jgi:tetratricopeptide (TPR) repeat protein
VIDRAAAMLLVSSTGSSDEIRIDEMTAGLLGARFVMEVIGSEHVLVGKRVGGEAERLLLGRISPCVGREKELALLEATFAECVEDSVARAVRVIAPAGAGKSRLCREFVARIRARTDCLVLAAHGEPVGAGSPFALARQLVRAAAPTTESELRAYLSQRMGESASLVADFLADLAGLEVHDAGPALRAARNDPRLMADRVQSSFSEWLGAETERRAVLVIVEDLHWGDGVSITLIETARAALRERPLMILMLARPDADELFPETSPSATAQTIRLSGLTRRAARRLVREMLGPAPPEETVTRIIELADGNAFYLEELIRRVAEGRSDELPETVLAMVESRLDRLSSEARRVLRAASVFGELFWPDAIEALLAGATNATDVREWLEVLVSGELVEPAPAGDRLEQPALRFRHALLREAAYSTFTPGDRATAHRLAAIWLEGAGKNDALVLADHWQRAGEPARAAPWLLRAARDALEGGNLDHALALSTQGMRDGATGEQCGHFHLIQTHVHGRRRDWERAAEHAAEAMRLVVVGSTTWFQAVAVAVFMGPSVFNRILVVDALADVFRLAADPEPSGPFGLSMVLLTTGLLREGQRDLAKMCLERMERVAHSRPEYDASFSAWLEVARSVTHMYGTGNVARGLEAAIAARDRFAQGDRLGRAYALMQLGFYYVELGSYEEAEASERDALALSVEISAPIVEWWAMALMARAWIGAGRLDEAERALRALDKPTDPFAGLLIDSWLAELTLLQNRLDEAERHAALLLKVAEPASWGAARAHAVMARVELARGRGGEGLSHANRGLGIQSSTAILSSDGSILRLARAEALSALGDTAGAQAAIAEARRAVLEIAGELADPLVRASYLTCIGVHTRIFGLAKAWDCE